MSGTSHRYFNKPRKNLSEIPYIAEVLRSEEKKKGISHMLFTHAQDQGNFGKKIVFFSFLKLIYSNSPDLQSGNT